jgi:lipoprotein-releasing system permease protein
MKLLPGDIPYEAFIARRLFRDKENSHHLSRKIILIALAGIALGITVMLLAVAIVTGFKKEISDKVTGFGADIMVISFDSNISWETAPVTGSPEFLPGLRKMEDVAAVQAFATKPGIIKTRDNLHGVVLKGVDGNFDWNFFRKHLIAGKIPDFSGERSSDVLISENIRSRLLLNPEYPLFIYFVNQNEKLPRVRQFRIRGIYKTNLQEFDDLFVLGDMRQVQQVNGWDSTLVSGFEVKLRDSGKLDNSLNEVTGRVISYGKNPESTMRTMSIKQKYPQIFDWLSILDMNVWIILILMVLVAGFNMISALLVLVLERVRMIGTLKAMGSKDKSIRKIFLYLSGFLISRGMLWGNLLGISLLLIQKYFRPLSLDAASYYMDYVPVHISLLQILFLNTGVLAITMVMMLLPGIFISRISPDKILRFD